MEKRLFDELAVILEVSPHSIKSCASLTEFRAYDSLAQIHIASMLENVFDVSVDPEDFESLDNTETLLGMIVKS
jgi:acyl carrier protein